VLLFGAFGLLLSAAASVLVPYLAWVSLSAGILLVLAGGRVLVGGSLYVGAADRLADRLGERAGHVGLAGYSAFGLAYALGSLGCTLPLFLTVVGTALTRQGLAAAIGHFVLYALGMATVLAILTVAAALFGQTLTRRAAKIGRYVPRVSAVLLLTVGAYVVYYWLTAGGLLADLIS